MDERREIRITLTEDEYVALKRTVSGETEALTQQDWDSGVFDALDSAEQAMNRAWARYMLSSSALRDVSTVSISRTPILAACGATAQAMLKLLLERARKARRSA